MAERLFLLEVLVDKVVVQRTGSVLERLNSQNDWGTGELCVTFQFLDYPHLEICEKDFASNKDECSDDTKTSFKSGKSCLFAVPTNQLDSLPEEFALNVGVLRKMPAGVLPDKLLIAQTKIELIEPLCSIIKDTCGCTSSDVPVSRTIKDCFSLMDPAGTKTIGTICVFVRVTCCGKSIVTQFQVGGEAEPATLFKGNESNKVYQFTNVDDSGPTCHPCCPWMMQLKKMQQGCSCSCTGPPPPRPPPCCPPPSCRPPPPCGPPPACGPPPPCRPPPPPPCGPPPPCRPPPPPPCRPPPPCCDIMPPKPAVGGGGECFCCDASTISELPQNLYEEIGAEINGHTLTIRVKKDKKKPFEDDDEFADEMCCPSKEDACCEPCPPCPNRSTLDIRPYGVDDAAGFKTKFPQKGAQQLCYKLRGCPNEDPAVPCDKCVLSEDPDQEAFVLRISKDRKSHLEFELKTPKKKEPEPPITTETKETQYLVSDLKTGKGKGKGKDKGKGKKGKKK